MSLLLSILLKTACPGTHHKLAVDALRFLRGDSADAWRDVFLRYHRQFLAGAIAPDAELKDFQNHVLYAVEPRWGGAIDAARASYDQLVAALIARQWAEAAQAAGKLSHYVSEPFFPLHTRQSDAGNAIQLAVEWSVNRAYGQLQAILEEDLGGYPAIEAPADGIDSVIAAGAALAAEHYDAVIGHFDLSGALLDPEEALDQELLDRLAACLGSAVVSFARILERAIAQAVVQPPKLETSASGLAALLKSPLRVLSDHTFDQIALRQIEAMHEELELTGRVNESLAAEQREVRRLYREQVPSAAADEETGATPAGSLYGQGAPPRYRPSRLRTETIDAPLAPAAPESAGEPAILPLRSTASGTPIENAPSITRTLAGRLRRAGIDTVGDLLAADPEFLADRLRLRGESRRFVDQWQAAARQSQPAPARNLRRAA